MTPPKTPKERSETYASRLAEQGLARVQVSAIVEKGDYDKAKAAAEKALEPFKAERDVKFNIGPQSKKGEASTRLSGLEILILKMLASSEVEMYGLEMVEQSGGKLKRGTIYVTLGRMQDKKLVRSRKEKQRIGAKGLPRRLYKPSAAGRRVLAEYLMQGDE